MKKLIILLSVILTQSTFSQNYVHQVLILNEGYFDYAANQSVIPPTIGSYNPTTQSYSVIDTLVGSRFASDMIISGDYFYVAADNMLYKYDKHNMSLLCTQQVNGIRNLAVWNDKIIVTRGDYDNLTFSSILFDSYLQVFNTSDLSFYMELDTISGPKWSTQNMIVDNDILYVTINNAFEWSNEKGIIGIVDLPTMSYVNEIDLGVDGKNPDNMFFDGIHLYTVNNKDWSGASISKIDLAASSSSTINISQVSTGCGSSCLRSGKINYQISGDTLLYEWDPFFMPSSGTSLGLNTNFYELAVDNVNNYLYASNTDFVSYGIINMYNSNNVLINSFNCGVSPGVLVFDIRSINVGISEQFEVNRSEKNIYDLTGKKIKSLNNCHSGIYLKNGKKIFYSK